MSDAWIKLPTEIAEQLFRRSFTQSELQIILMVMRYSLGCKHNVAIIPKDALFARHCSSVHKQNVRRDIDKLVERRVIIEDVDGPKGHSYRLNENYDEWLPVLEFDKERLYEHSQLVRLNVRSEQMEEIRGGDRRSSSATTKAKAEVKKLTGVAKKKMERADIIQSIFDFWCEQKIVDHTRTGLSTKMITAINLRLDDYSLEEVLTAIATYKEILSQKKYFFNYTWTLVDFFNRGFEKFVEEDRAKSNYRKDDIRSAPVPEYEVIGEGIDE